MIHNDDDGDGDGDGDSDGDNNSHSHNNNNSHRVTTWWWVCCQDNGGVGIRYLNLPQIYQKKMVLLWLQEEIEAALEEVCNLLPSTLKSEVGWFVSFYPGRNICRKKC